MNKKTAFLLPEKIFSKDGFDQGVQRYKCASCGKRFKGGNRLNIDFLWDEYTKGKQTYSQLATKYECFIKTIQRKIDTVKTKSETVFPSVVNVLMDTTFFGESWA